MYGRDDADGTGFRDDQPYNADDVPTGDDVNFDLVRIDSQNVDNRDLAFVVESLPDKSEYQFCWNPMLYSRIRAICGDVKVNVKRQRGWLNIYADVQKGNPVSAYRVWHRIYDFPVQRMELSAEDTRSKLKVYKGVIVRPPPAVVDCGDYPGLNRERFNCLVNGEKLPPAPDVGTDETLLHNSLNLVQPKENYTLVFREEFDGGSENDPCGNLRLLRKEVWSYSDEICAMTDVNGKICEGVEDGSYVMSISQSCRPRGLKNTRQIGLHIWVHRDQVQHENVQVSKVHESKYRSWQFSARQ